MRLKSHGGNLFRDVWHFGNKESRGVMGVAEKGRERWLVWGCRSRV